jgi:hypothetical protein
MHPMATVGTVTIIGLINRNSTSATRITLRIVGNCCHWLTNTFPQPVRIQKS